MGPAKLILVRHGETAWNQERKYLGHSNPRLNTKGQAQARTAANLLLKEEIDLVFSSDLLRCLETSLVIAGIHNVPVIITPSLREMNFGDWEGLTFEDIQRLYPEYLKEWLKNPFKVRVPGGETAEEVRHRVLESWNSIMLKASGKKTVVIVAHGGPLRMLICQLTGLDPSRQWDLDFGHGKIIVLEKNGELYMQSGNRNRNDATKTENSSCC